MSTSVDAKLDLAKTLLNHSALPAVREDVQRRLFNKFRTATPSEREVINYILDNEALFFKELSALVAQYENIGGDENER